MQLRLWIRALRAPFFQCVIVPTILGTAVAWYKTGVFYPGYFLLALLGVVFLNAGTNLANDYFDHTSGADTISRELTPFSGGSRVIQQGLIPPRVICTASALFFAGGVLVGVYLGWARGWVILVLGIVGVLSGYFYTASPIRLGYRGCGEIVVGLNLGPLTVLGAYYVQTGSVGLEAFVASIPIGLLIAAVLYINEFPDHDADKAARKNTIVVLLGKERAIRGFYLLVVSAYSAIALGAMAGMVPSPGLLALLTLPLAWRTVRKAASNYSDTTNLRAAMGGMILLHLTVGVLLSVGYVAGRILVGPPGVN